MMIRQRILTLSHIMGIVVLFLVFSKSSEGIVQPPEILMVEQLWEVRHHDEQREQLLQTATFYDDQKAVINLLDHLRQLDRLDTHNFDKLRIYRMLMERMTCQPERLIVERLRVETDAWEKTKLMHLLRDFYSVDVFNAFFEQLDDVRKISCEHCGQIRVCDKAYTFLVFDLEVLGFIKERQFGDVYGSTPEQQHTFITEFKQYWETNKAFIFQELPKRHIPEYLQRMD